MDDFYQTNPNHEDREIMNALLHDALDKGWKILDRYTAPDGWMCGVNIEFVVLMKGRGTTAEIASCYMHRSPERELGGFFMRQNPSGGHYQWAAQ